MVEEISLRVEVFDQVIYVDVKDLENGKDESLWISDQVINT